MDNWWRITYFPFSSPPFAVWFSTPCNNSNEFNKVTSTYVSMEEKVHVRIQLFSQRVLRLAIFTNISKRLLIKYRHSIWDLFYLSFLVKLVDFSLQLYENRSPSQIFSKVFTYFSGTSISRKAFKLHWTAVESKSRIFLLDIYLSQIVKRTVEEFFEVIMFILNK